jgi:quinol-cytochrome oxidoreductase complex cytochrome b subunit
MFSSLKNSPKIVFNWHWSRKQVKKSSVDRRIVLLFFFLNITIEEQQDKDKDEQKNKDKDDKVAYITYHLMFIIQLMFMFNSLLILYIAHFSSYIFVAFIFLLLAVMISW